MNSGRNPLCLVPLLPVCTELPSRPPCCRHSCQSSSSSQILVQPSSSSLVPSISLQQGCWTVTRAQGKMLHPPDMA